MTLRALMVFIIFSIFFTLSAYAAEFQPLGFEALSMGGAGVASSKGSYAAYYNPALLAVPRHKVEISISPGVAFREINVVDSIDTLSDIDVENTLNELASFNYQNLDTLDLEDPVSVLQTIETVQDDIKTITRELRSLSNKNGLQLMPNACLGVQTGNFGFGVFGMSEATASAVIDSERLDPIIGVDVNGTAYYVEYDETDNNFIFYGFYSYCSYMLRVQEFGFAYRQRIYSIVPDLRGA